MNRTAVGEALRGEAEGGGGLILHACRSSRRGAWLELIRSLCDHSERLTD